MRLENIIDTLHLELLGSLILASLLGGAIGLERALSGKPAGFRTHILIALGAALLTDISFKVAAVTMGDPLRIPAQIVSGLGFLGAGAILQEKNKITGLTTAAGLWVSAAVGIACAAGLYVEAVGTTLLVILSLGVLGKVEKGIISKVSLAEEERDNNFKEL